MAAVAGAMAAAWFYRRSPSLPFYILFYDGSAYSIQRAKLTKSGNLAAASIEYSLGVLRLADGAEALGMRLYVLAAEPMALADHRSLERSRKSIITGALFKPGGDMVQLMQMLGAAAVLGCSIYMFMVIGNVSQSLADQKTVIEKVQETLSRPLVVDTGGKK